MTAPAEIACSEAESAVLGALLLLGAKGATVATSIEVEDLADPRHRAVLGCVHTLLAAGIAPDQVAVLGELRRSGAARSMTADRSAGVFLADLVAAVPAPASAGHYARIVREHSARRRVAEAACRLDQLAGTAGLDVLTETVAAELRAVLAALERAEPPSGRATRPRAVAA